MNVPTDVRKEIPFHKNTVFMRTFVAHIFSSLGDWLDFIALLTLFTYVWKADVFLISALPVAYALPGILLSQAAGVWVDRLPPRQVLMYVDVLRSTCTLLLLCMPSPASVLCLVFIRAAIGVFHVPAQQLFIRRMVTADQLRKATGLIGTSFQLTKIIGPMLGSFVLALSSYKLCLLLTAGCLLLSVLLLFFLPVHDGSASSKEAEPAAGFYAEWKAGWATIFSLRIVLFCLLFSFIITTVIQIVDIQMAVLLRTIKPEQAELPGWIISAIGLGAVCSTAYITKQKKNIHYLLLLSSGSFLMGAAVLMFSTFSEGTPVYYLLLAGGICGVGTGLSFISVQLSIQQEVPSQMLGRVYGIYHSIFHLLLIIAPLTGGWLVRLHGPHAVFRICGIAAITIGLCGFFLQKRLKAEQFHISETEERNTPSLL
ncbi:MFS transporter [Aneurinibacillus sp. BA2021]|nr:MFS transporter [Aneurinibacillus sp. BA2021]